MSADLTHLRATLTEHGSLDKSTVLALLSRLEQAEQAVQRVRELHWRRTDRVGFCADSGNPIFRNVCGYCNDDHADGGGVPCPCDTIIALDGDTRG